MMSQQYQQDTEHFLTQARRELAAGDLPQVSGRAGVPLSRSSRLSRNGAAGNTAGIDTTSLPSASRLRSATGDGDIRCLFRSVSDLHENFYENTMLVFEVVENLDDVEGLLGKLLPFMDQT